VLLIDQALLSEVLALTYLAVIRSIFNIGSMVWRLKMICFILYSVQVVRARGVVMATSVCLPRRKHVGLLVSDRCAMLLVLQLKVLVLWLLDSLLVAS